MKTAIALLAAVAAAAFARADDVTFKTVVYEFEGKTFESSIVIPAAAADEALPGILMIPNWMGPTDASLDKATKVAGDDYIVMMVDMYGTEVRPANAQEAGEAAGAVRGDRAIMRARAAKALEVFKAEAAVNGLDTDKIAAIGFCFGGGAALELGRSGADIDAIVSFHGDLLSPTLEADAKHTRAKVLALHGADDPYVPQGDVQAFIEVMKDTDVDWQLVQYSGTVHSFTNPNADSDGARYHPRSASRAFEAMDDLFDEIWD